MKKKRNAVFRFISLFVTSGIILAMFSVSVNQCYAAEKNEYTFEAVSGGNYHSVGLENDGTVVAVGDNTYGQLNVSGWTDIIQVSAGWNNTVGLKSNGTVVAVGQNSCGQINVGSWTDIVQVVGDYNYTAGLKSNGTVVFTGDVYNGIWGQYYYSGWTDIIQLAAGSNTLVGLKSNGTVVLTGYTTGMDVSGWTDIIQVTAGAHVVYGLKSDGTVVGTGLNGAGQLNVGSWTNIKKISSGHSFVIGLKENGTLVGAGYNYFGQINVGSWTSITELSTGADFTLGVKSDGTVVGCGYNDFGQRNVSGWTNIVTSFNTAPNINITSPTNNSIYSAISGYNTISLSGNVSDANSGDVITTYYKIDGGADVAVAGTVTTSGAFTATNIDVSGLAEGDHTLSVWAKDQKNKVSETIMISFKVDKTGPVVTSDNEDYNWKNTDININLSPSDAPSGVTSMGYKVTNSIDVPGSYDAYVGQITIADEGTYYVHFTAVDSVGNVTNNYFGPYRIDKTVPGSPEVTRDPNTDINNGDYVVTITPGLDGLSGVAITEYRLTGAITQDWTVYTVPLDISADGQVIIESKTTDYAGNEAISTVTVFSYDGLYLDADAAVLIAEGSNLQADKEDATTKIGLLPLNAPERATLLLRLNLVQEIIDIRAGINVASTMADIDALWVRIQMIPDEHFEKPNLTAELIQKALDISIISTVTDVYKFQGMINTLEEGYIKDTLQNSFNVIKTPILLDAAMQSLAESIANLTSQGTVYIDIPTLPNGHTSTFTIEENGIVIYTTHESGHIPLSLVKEGHTYTFMLTHSDDYGELGSRIRAETIADLTRPVIMGAYVLDGKLYILAGDNFGLIDNPFVFTLNSDGSIIENNTIDDLGFLKKTIIIGEGSVEIVTKKDGAASVSIPTVVRVRITDALGLFVEQVFNITKKNEVLCGDVPEDIISKINQANNIPQNTDSSHIIMKGSISVTALDESGNVLTRYVNNDMNLTLQVVTAPKIPGYILTSTSSITVWLNISNQTQEVIFYYTKDLTWEGWQELEKESEELETDTEITEGIIINRESEETIKNKNVPSLPQNKSFPQNKTYTSINNNLISDYGISYDDSIQYDENILNNKIDEPGSGTVWGIVTDNNGNPLKGILVELHSKPRQVYTNEKGEYRFDNVEVGMHNIIINDIKQPLFISKETNKRIDFKIIKNGAATKRDNGTLQEVSSLNNDSTLINYRVISIFVFIITILSILILIIKKSKNIFILDETGKKVFSHRHKNNNPLELDLSDLDKGTYNIKVKDKDKKKVTIINGDKKDKVFIKNGHLIYNLE